MLNLRELDVLAILWAKEEPLTAVEIVEGKKGLTQSTVTAVLRALLKKELVEVDGVTHSGKVLSRTYRPTQKSVAAIVDHLKEDYQRVSDVISPSELCMKIIEMTGEKDKLTKKEITKLKNFIKEYEKKRDDE